MKKFLLLGFAATTLAFTQLSHADYVFHSSASNSCENLSGQWTGSGKAYNWLVGECVYNGQGRLDMINKNGSFTVDVIADKESGSSLCPAHTKQHIVGICANSVATIITDYGNISGSFSDKAGEAKGNLSVAPGMNAEVVIKFNKVD